MDAPNGPKDVLDALHTATRQLMDAQTQQAVCEVAVGTVGDILEHPLTAIWLYDETTHSLRPAAHTAETQRVVGEHPTFTPGNSLSWQAFESGTAQRFDDVQAEQGVHNANTPIRSEMILPLGEYGVMNIGSMEAGAFDDDDIYVAKIVAANTEAALERAAREQTLQSQNARLSEFVSVVSHDLRNPLNVAMGNLELAGEQCESEYLDRTDAALDRMAELIDHLLMLARQGKEVGQLSVVELDEVATAAWTHVETADAVLDVVDTCSMQADSERLSQLMENLFRNAVVHAGDDVTVRVGTLPKDGGFYVEDDGPGIPLDDRRQIFEYGHTTAGGNGLGLAIVRAIAEAHGWQVRATESEAGGARFECSSRPESETHNRADSESTETQ